MESNMKVKLEWVKSYQTDALIRIVKKQHLVVLLGGVDHRGFNGTIT